MKICKNVEFKGQNSNICLLKGIFDVFVVDVFVKKILCCSILDWEVVKFFFKDVILKFYFKLDFYDLLYVVFGN